MSLPQPPALPGASLSLVVLALLLLPAWVSAATEERYRLPDEDLIRIVDAPRTPRTWIGPDQRWLLLGHRPTLPSIADLARQELKLAGLRFYPESRAPSRARTYSGLELVKLESGRSRPVLGLPEDARIYRPTWSPDGRRVAFVLLFEDRCELWGAEVRSGKARRLAETQLNLAFQEPLRWLSDSKGLLCATLPVDLPPPPAAPKAPEGPIIREAAGEAAPARTFQNLLQSTHDADLFEHYLTSRLTRVGWDGELTYLGEPGLIEETAPSPDGRYVLVHILHRPFSQLVPVHRFPRRIEIWDRQGRLVRRVVDRQLQESVPIAHGSVMTGPRRIEWRADDDAELLWVEALDGGDGAARADRRDRLLLQAAPFEEPPRVLAELEHRYGGIQWSTGDLALLREYWWPLRLIRRWHLRPDRPEEPAEVVQEYSWEDRYGHPGDPLEVRDSTGRLVLLTGPGDTLYLTGRGASPEGSRPFLDRLDLETGETTRLFRSQAPWYETPLLPLDRRGRRILTWRESKAEPPNIVVRDLRSGDARRVTRFTDPTPELRGIQKELLRYERADGVPLTGMLYLPPGYQPGQGRLPLLLSAYPVEFKDPAAAGQVTDSPYRFDWIGSWSPLIWLTQGFAVLDGPDMPIVGQGDAKANDTYLEQLVAGAEAAIQAAVARGVADPERVAVGGHSYGAFMVANLLAHSDLFAAGIAKTGAYNRTLTPFGFQSEDRTLWEAPETYLRMSPFLHAHGIDEPLLLIHGQDDDNSGTFPIQSERMFQALKGLGGRSRLVLLPHEGHGYRARESVLHVLWEVKRWLALHVE